MDWFYRAGAARLPNFKKFVEKKLLFIFGCDMIIKTLSGTEIPTRQKQ